MTCNENKEEVVSCRKGKSPAVTIAGRMRGRSVANRCRTNSAHIRQSRPDPGLGFLGEILKTC